MANNQTQQLTADEQKQLEEAVAKGKQLGVLIAALPVTDETKEALLTILPDFTPEQIERLRATLEAMYLHAKTADVDKALIEEIAKINANYNAKVKATADKALAEFDKIAKQAGV